MRWIGTYKDQQTYQCPDGKYRFPPTVIVTVVDTGKAFLLTSPPYDTEVRSNGPHILADPKLQRHSEANRIFPTARERYDIFFTLIQDNFTSWVYGPSTNCAKIFNFHEKYDDCVRQAAALAMYHGATVLPTTYLHSYWARNHYRVSKPMNVLRLRRDQLCITPENQDTTKYGESGSRGST